MSVLDILQLIVFILPFNIFPFPVILEKTVGFQSQHLKLYFIHLLIPDIFAGLNTKVVQIIISFVIFLGLLRWCNRVSATCHYAVFKV